MKDSFNILLQKKYQESISVFLVLPTGGSSPSSTTGKPLCVVFLRTSTRRATFSTSPRVTTCGLASACSPTVKFLIHGSGFASKKGRPLSCSIIS
ncbi:unnamed protein product, partial [Vitis vinifera]|uniref:Uncharacterized protein n=1 Tax=Vitis vinifera TaxID=29760 RepID=D7UE47_VITVI